MKTVAARKMDEDAGVRTRLAAKAAKRYEARGQTSRRRAAKRSFLKPDVEDWLRNHDGRAILLRQAGALAADETWPEMLAGIYAKRGRPQVEE